MSFEQSYAESHMELAKTPSQIAEDRLGSEPKGAPPDRPLILEVCVKIHVPPIAAECVPYLYCFQKRHVTELQHGMQPYGPSCGSTISVQI